MKLLIVEDDVHVIQGIQQNIDWKKLGITDVYPALGSLAARKQLKETKIDLMICDIEMPRETGLDLLEWMRRENMNVQTIFFTSYAKFEYAQRAIQLNSVEYILKPVDYGQLEKALWLAADKAHKWQQSERWKENHHYWEQNRRNVTEYVWREILNGKLSKDEEVLNRRLEECGISYGRDSVFLPVVFQILKSSENEQKKLEEIVEGLSCSNYCENQDAFVWREFFGWISENVGVCLLGTRLNYEPGETEQYMEELLDELKQGLKDARAEVLCGVGMWSILALLFEDVENTCAMLYETPQRQEKIVKLSQYHPMDTLCEVPDWEEWQRLMTSGQMDGLAWAVENYLRVLDHQQKMTSRNLQQLGMDLTQMVYAGLSSMNLYAHHFFDNEESNRLYARAALSPGHMMQYLHYLLSRAGEYQAVLKRPKSMIDQVKQYMDEHFQENISREDLSRQVFLNPDYLSRLFKKETGVSISGYLMQKRIGLAKELLAGTRMPISVIAAQVGYDNFAYFTKVFKEKTGMSPNKFRKNWQRQGDSIEQDAEGQNGKE